MDAKLRPNIGRILFKESDDIAQKYRDDKYREKMRVLWIIFGMASAAIILVSIIAPSIRIIVLSMFIIPISLLGMMAVQFREDRDHEGIIVAEKGFIVDGRTVQIEMIKEIVVWRDLKKDNQWMAIVVLNLVDKKGRKMICGLIANYTKDKAGLLKVVLSNFKEKVREVSDIHDFIQEARLGVEYQE